VSQNSPTRAGNGLEKYGQSVRSSTKLRFY
jgi:hypothetical protein